MTRRSIVMAVVAGIAVSLSSTAPSASAQSNNQCGNQQQVDYTITNKNSGSYEVVTGIGANTPSVTCRNTPPGEGWTLVDAKCTANNGSNCHSEMCLWSKASNLGNQEYIFTHHGGDLSDSVDCSTAPPAGSYQLKGRACFSPNGVGGCISDVCLWGRSSNQPTSLRLTQAGASAALRENVDCRNNGYEPGTKTDRVCLLSAYIGGENHCLSDLCLASAQPQCQQQQTGCIDVTKLTYNANGSQITPVAQFTFRLENGQTALNDSTGRARFSNIPVGSHTVSEDVPQGWQLLTQNNLSVNVLPGSQCAQVTFQNRQYYVGGYASQNQYSNYSSYSSYNSYPSSNYTYNPYQNSYGNYNTYGNYNSYSSQNQNYNYGSSYNQYPSSNYTYNPYQNSYGNYNMYGASSYQPYQQNMNGYGRQRRRY